MEPIQLELLSRSLGPPCSNVVHFLLEDNINIYRAYGVPGGTIVVQSLKVKGKSHKDQPFETVAVISPPSDSNVARVDDVKIISWGGGPFNLLAAATTQSISIYSLNPEEKPVQPTNKGDANILGNPCHVKTWETSSPPAGVAWTQDCGGLLVSESSGFVSGLLITIEPVDQLGEVEELSARSSISVLDRNSLSKNKQLLKADVDSLWAGELNFQQDLIAAGQNIQEPAATAASGVSKSVSIWCLSTTNGYKIETLKHPRPVIGVDWSPGGAPMTTTSALLTSCADGVTRVWVKTTLGGSKLLGPDLAELEEPYVFALVLIIEPPIPFMPMRENISGVWVHGSKGNSTTCKTLWVVLVHQDKDARDGKMHLSLCAVDGLQNVFLSVDQGPRKIVWGRTNLISGPEGISRVSAFMISPQPIPEVLVVESTWNSMQQSAESQVLLLHCPSGQISKLTHRNFVIDGPLSSIVSLAMHPFLDMMCIVKSDLSISIWDIWPVKRLARIHGESVSLSSGIQTAYWINHRESSCAGFLLLAGRDGISVCTVTLDEQHPFHISVKLVTIAFIELPEGELGVRHMMSLGEKRSQSNSGAFWFLILGQKTVSAAHILKIQFECGKSTALSFSGTYVPLGLGEESIATITAARGDKHVSKAVVGDSQGKIIILDFDLGEVNPVASSTYNLGCTDGGAGVVKSVAICEHAPYIACTTGLGPEEQEDSLWILESESGDLTVYSVEAQMALDGTPADIAWINGCPLVMALAVCFEAGGLDIFVRTRHASWEVVARYPVGLPIVCMDTTRLGLPVIGAGAHLLVLSCASSRFHRRYFLGDSVAGSSLAMGGTQSDYSPEGLATFLNVGFDCMAVAIGRSLASWLQEEETTGSNVSSTMLGPIAPFEALVGEVLSSTDLTWPDGIEIELQVPYSMINGFQSSQTKFSEPAKFSSMLKTSGTPPAAPKQQSSSMQATGLLDMSAFGMDMEASPGAQQGNNGMAEREPKHVAQSASFEFDASAFGFGMDTPARVEATPSVDSGLLDPSSFGLTQSTSTQAPSSSDTGMLSAGAFGFGIEDPIQHQTAPSVHSGMLDPSAFGFDTSSSTPAEFPSDTGMLDPGVFGYRNKDLDNRQPTSSDRNTGTASENSSGQLDEIQPKERCITLKRFNLKPRSKSLHQSVELPKETHAILAKYSLLMKDEQYVSKAAQSLGLTNIELVQACSVLLNTIGCENKEIERLDIAGKRMVTSIQIHISLMEGENESTEQVEPITAPAVFNGPKGLPRPVSTMSLTSLATSLGTSIVVEGQGAVSAEWTKRVGLLKGIAPVHLLWAAQSGMPKELLSCCLELAAQGIQGGTGDAQSGNSAMEAMNFMDVKSKKLTWEKLRAVGAGFWLSDPSEVAKIAEEMARAEYAESRDPQKCALMYVALGKQRLLSTMFRGFGRTRVADLLGRDFSDQSSQQAAAKNAYALLSKHQHSMAAAFFLLGKQYNDAIGVCAREMGDPQLALFLATLIDGQDGDHKSRIIKKILIPDVVESCEDRAAQALLLWVGGRHSEALTVLMTLKQKEHDRLLSQQVICTEALIASFVLEEGLPSLAGRYIPVSIFEKMLFHVEFCAHILGVYGLPLLGLHVLGGRAGLMKVESTSNKSGTRHVKELELNLVAAVMVRHLPAPKAVSDREPYLIEWRERVRSDLQLLQEHELSMDEDSIMTTLDQLMAALFEIPSNPVHRRLYSVQPELGAGKREALVSNSPAPPEAMNCLLSIEPRELMNVDGDICSGVCCSRAAEIQGPIPSAHLHRVAVGTGRHGMHYVEWGTPPLISGGEYWHALRHHRWPKNGWIESEDSWAETTISPAATRDLHSGPLISHPAVDLFLSSSKTAAVHLWKFGDTSPCAKFFPSFSLGSSTLKGWSSPQSICWSASGDRLAAVGMDGSCATWQLDSGTRTEAGGLSGWEGMVVPRRGSDIKFADGSGSVLVVSGEDENGHGQLRLWDTLAPRGAAEIANFQFQGALRHMVTIPGTQILVSGFSSGAVLAHDLRMLQNSLWALTVHSGHVTSMITGWGPFGPQEAWNLVVATGGKDGDVCIVDKVKESGDLRQRLMKAHWKKSSQLSDLILSGLKSGLGGTSRRSSFGSTGRSQSGPYQGATVLDLGWCDEGLLSAGADGYLQLFPWGDTQEED